MAKREKAVKEFVEKIDNMKKVNPKDLSSDQDLSLAVMNLIAIEEHLVFTGAKTEKTSYYDMVEGIRDIRKHWMEKLIPEYEGEVWCTSKHLLSASMRLMEVGTKQQTLNNPEEAYKLFDQAYELYCLYWALNMKLIDMTDVEWIKDDEEQVKKITEKMNAIKTPVKAEKKSEKKAEKNVAKASSWAKFKDVVRKAVDCCIE